MSPMLVWAIWEVGLVIWAFGWAVDCAYRQDWNGYGGILFFGLFWPSYLILAPLGLIVYFFYRLSVMIGTYFRTKNAV